MKTFFKRLVEQGFFTRLPDYLLLMIGAPFGNAVLLVVWLEMMQEIPSVLALNRQAHAEIAGLASLIFPAAMVFWLFNLVWQDKFLMKWGSFIIFVVLCQSMQLQGIKFVDPNMLAYLVLYFAPIIWILGMLDYVWENYVPAVVQWFMMDEQEREKAKLEEAL